MTLEVEMPKLFGTSGIRGIANREVTSELALKVGLALATYIENGSFLVARDTRVSGEMIENALTAGILAGGANANKIGIAPTPALAFLTKKHSLNAGVMITASHNPPEYNGIKIFNSDSTGFNEKQQEEIEKIIENENFRLAEWNKIGKCVDVKYWIKDYIHQILGNLSFKKSWFVVVDPGCGATSTVAPFIFRELGCKVRALNAQPDGFFPARSPLPDKESLKPLGSVVRELKADIGIAYDGDGDRVVFMDENGNFVSLDQSLALYAAYVIERNRGGTVVTHVEASMCVEDTVEKLSGKVLRTKVGDVSIANAMKNCGAVFGGEPCGAWIHPEHHFCPDGILSSVLFL
ncbi:phosphoglucosamine mutase, partial [Candidatus Bathyarchaeota archaeon]